MKQWMNAFVRGGGSRILRGRIRPRFAPIGWILRASSAAKKIRCAQDGEESSITSCNETDRSTPTTTTNPSQSRPFCAN